MAPSPPVSSSVKKSTFFSIGKRRRQSFATVPKPPPDKVSTFYDLTNLSLMFMSVLPNSSQKLFVCHISLLQVLAHGSDSEEDTPPIVAPRLARQIDFGEKTIVLGSDPEEEEDERLPVADREQDDLLTDDGEGAAGDLLTEDEASNSPSDSVPLVSLGRKFLSESSRVL